MSITDRPEWVRWETDRRGTIRQSGRVRFVRKSTANNTSSSPNPNPLKAATFVTCGTLIW